MPCIIMARDFYEKFLIEMYEENANHSNEYARSLCCDVVKYKFILSLYSMFIFHTGGIEATKKNVAIYITQNTLWNDNGTTTKYT